MMASRASARLMTADDGKPSFGAAEDG